MKRSFNGLLKVAQTPTVGDVMNRINADMTLNSFDKRNLLDAVRNTGLPVSALGSRLAYAGIGAFAASKLSKYLGANPFWVGVSTLGGALYGNKLYNDKKEENNHPFGRNIYTVR